MKFCVEFCYTRWEVPTGELQLRQMCVGSDAQRTSPVQ